jgi:prepilin-type N-terminal cleavage/methylation domain-containing protein/prepilin-type processing-associated H-X9-DG protein
MMTFRMPPTCRRPRCTAGLRRTGAFTLIELLVVMSVIGILVALLLPALSASRQRAQDIQCRSNLHGNGVALHAYALDNREAVMPAVNLSTASPPSVRWTTILIQGRYINLVRHPATGALIPDQATPTNCPAMHPNGRIDASVSWDRNYGITSQVPAASDLRLDRIQKHADAIWMGDSVRYNLNPQQQDYMFYRTYVAADAKMIHTRHAGSANLLYIGGNVRSVPKWVPATDRFILAGYNPTQTITCYTDEKGQLIQ